MIRLLALLILLGAWQVNAATSAEKFFAQGVEAYTNSEYGAAAALFHESAKAKPTFETFQNWGSAEWLAGQNGLAILAWERAAWLEAYDPNPPMNLRFARGARLIDPPDLTWYENYSAALPVNAWPWLAMVTFWLAVALVILPDDRARKRSSVTQGLAALSFAAFLFTIPGLVGVQTRTQIGIVLAANTPLRLTPTAEGQVVSRLAAGEAARQLRRRSHYIYVRTTSGNGWLDEKQFGRIAGAVR